jgi:uncharacterized protein (DUF169 family)
MITLEELHEMGRELEGWLRMRVHPVAVKLFRDKDEVPEEAVIPTRDWGHKYALCQTLARSQRNGETIAMFKSDHWCPEPVVGLGLAERIPFFLEGHHRYPDSVRDLKAGSEWCTNMPCLEYGACQGTLSAPINTCTFMPDVIVMHVNGMMASQLLNVRNWIDGKDIHTQLSGHAACVYAIVPPLLKRDCHVAIPCKGDRSLANAQDDEILFSMLPEMLPDFMEGVRWLHEHGWSIPMIQRYQEEYDLKLSYKDLAEGLGMDVQKSPPRPQKFREH